MPIAIDKSKSPLWVRIVVWVLVVGLVAGIGVLTAVQVMTYWTSAGSTPTSTGAVTPEEASVFMASIDERYQPELEQLRAKLETDPDNLELTIEAAEKYLSWAQELAMINDQTVQLMAQLQASQSLALWERAAELDPADTQIQQQVAQLKSALGQE